MIDKKNWQPYPLPHHPTPPTPTPAAKVKSFGFFSGFILHFWTFHDILKKMGLPPLPHRDSNCPLQLFHFNIFVITLKFSAFHFTTFILVTLNWCCNIAFLYWRFYGPAASLTNIVLQTVSVGTIFFPFLHFYWLDLLFETK